MSQLAPADITWHTDEHGNITPTSVRFDDIYFSRTGGLAESHYVFLDGNELPRRFGALGDFDVFTIVETGFGTGLNFLATCLLWSKTAQPSARLYFVSTEKFPLTSSDLATALSVWQDDDLRPFIHALMDGYPLALTGCHRLHFGQITLDLWLGDAKDSFSQMAGQIADAWYLDGFAPAKNSELWSADVFAHIQRLSKPHATLATFTSSGAVRRALQGIGMNVVKVKGFGRKREMLTAHFSPCPALPNTPTTPFNTPLTMPKSATVIGAGVSGLFVAHALACRGVSVSIVDKNAPIAGASGNPKALLAPKLTTIDDAPHHLPTVSFLYSERVYRALNALSDGVFCQTGVVDFLLPTQKSYDKLKYLTDSYPDELICTFNDHFNLDNDDFNRQTINTLIKKAGLIDTQALADLLLSHPLINFKKCAVHTIENHDNHIIIKGDNDTLICDMAVICAGFESHLLHNSLFNPRKIRGQVSFLSIADKCDNIKSLLKTPIKYDGYCASFIKDNTPMFLMGASFVRNDTDISVRDDEHLFNLNKLSASLPNLANHLNINTNALQGRASIRAQTPDYHPLVGQIDKRLYAFYGMGSKGFGFAPLCAEVLVGLIFNEPLPISQKLLDKLNPQRPRLQIPIGQQR